MRALLLATIGFALAMPTGRAMAHEWLDYFQYGRVELSPLGYRTARSVAAYVEGRSDYLITIVAHMDTAEDDEFSDELGSRRAQAMATELFELGVDPSKIAMASRGATQLARATPDHRSEPLNRRLVVNVNLTAPR